MAKTDKMQMDPLEWLNDLTVRSLTTEDRAMLMDLYCQMWLSSERGVMIGARNHILTKREILFLCKDTYMDDEWLDRLVESTLIQIRHDGAYYSPKMVKQHQITEARKKAGSKGGRKTITRSKVESEPERLQAEDTKPEPGTPVPSIQSDMFGVPEAKPSKPKTKLKAAERIKQAYAEFVTLTEAEYQKLVEQFGEVPAKEMINILSNYKGSTGKKYKSDYRTILNWVVDRYNEKIARYGVKHQQNKFDPTETDPTSYTEDL